MIEGICAAGLSTWIAVVLLEQIHVQLPDLQVCRCLFATEPVQVGHLPTLAMTRNGELGFDTGEGACEAATTSKEGSRRTNCPCQER